MCQLMQALSAHFLKVCVHCQYLLRSSLSRLSDIVTTPVVLAAPAKYM